MWLASPPKKRRKRRGNPKSWHRSTRNVYEISKVSKPRHTRRLLEQLCHKDANTTGVWQPGAACQPSPCAVLLHGCSVAEVLLRGVSGVSRKLGERQTADHEKAAEGHVGRRPLQSITMERSGTSVLGEPRHGNKAQHHHFCSCTSTTNSRVYHRASPSPSTKPSTTITASSTAPAPPAQENSPFPPTTPATTASASPPPTSPTPPAFYSRARRPAASNSNSTW